MKNPLIQALENTGIQPANFAYFLSEFIKSKPQGKDKLSKLLTGVMKAQAELIRFNLTR